LVKTLGNGVFTTYTYDSSGQLLDLFNQKQDSSVLSRFQYIYDERGRRISMTTSYGESDSRTDLAGRWQYEFDDTSQLIGWTAPWGRRVEYSYDALGNRINVLDDGADTTYTVNSLNQYIQVGSTTYHYDADGNLARKVAVEGQTTFDWSADNKLVRVDGLDDISLYNYDARGYRASVADGDTVKEYVIDPTGFGNVVGEYSQESGILLAQYEHGDGLLSRSELGRPDNFFTFDGLGSSSELHIPAGTISNAYVYAPFGELDFGLQTVDVPFRFVGQSGVMLGKDELSYMRARFYDVSLGRFISPDPAGLVGRDVNLYSYVRNLPTQVIDPSGNNPLVPILVFCGLNPELCVAIVAGVVDCAAALADAEIPNSQVPGLGDLIRSLGVGFVCKKIRDLFNSSEPSPAPAPRPNPNPNPPDFCEVYPELCMCFEGTPMCTPVPPVPPVDPNAKTGPIGFGSANYLGSGTLHAYQVEFENLESAEVPAQIVYVSDQLSMDFDWSTFELTDIAFGDVFISIPPGTKRFEKTEKMRFNGVEFDVEIEAGIHLDTGEVYAAFRSVVPETGLPPSIEVGFLPPENGTGRGQGHFSYLIRPHADLPTGTEVRNIANITFDGSFTIPTNIVDPLDLSKGTDPDKEALVTIDSGAPVSSVEVLPLESDSEFFRVTWSGEDDAGGSGFANYDIYYSVDGGEFEPWLEQVPATSADFWALGGRTYEFYSRARDNVGNLEDAHFEADASTSSSFQVPEEFTDWRVLSFPNDYPDPAKGSSVWGISADADFDGLPNILEYFMGTDPNNKDFPTQDLRIEITDTEILVKYRRAKIADGVTGSLQHSTDMVEWQSEGITFELPIDEGDHELIRAKFPLNDNTRQWYRLFVEMNP
jgi:RHS repeat-associated protein